MKFSLVLGFLAFGGVGGVMLWRPEYLSQITGLDLTTAESRNEARAIYGGGSVAIALALLWAMIFPDFRDGTMFTTGLMLMGMAGGRGYSVWIERATSPVIWSLLGAQALLGFMIFFRF